jgi:hypothetical protein
MLYRVTLELDYLATADSPDQAARLVDEALRSLIGLEEFCTVAPCRVEPDGQVMDFEPDDLVYRPFDHPLTLAETLAATA